MHSGPAPHSDFSTIEKVVHGILTEKNQKALDAATITKYENPSRDAAILAHLFWSLDK